MSVLGKGETLNGEESDHRAEKMPEVARDGVTCVSCASPGDKKCTACHSVTYCSQKCQKKDWSRHKRLCVPVMVQKTAHKGNGLVASRDFKMGELILKEKACMARGEDSGQEALSQLNRMTADDRSDFYNLTRAAQIIVLQLILNFKFHLKSFCNFYLG